MVRHPCPAAKHCNTFRASRRAIRAPPHNIVTGAPITARGSPPSQQIFNSRSKIATAWPDFRNAPNNNSCMADMVFLHFHNSPTGA